MAYEVSERFALVSSVVTHGVLVAATVCAFAVHWWYLAYLFFVFLPAALVAIANYWLIRPPNGWLRTFPPGYTVLSLTLVITWLAVSGVQAFLKPWLGH